METVLWLKYYPPVHASESADEKENIERDRCDVTLRSSLRVISSFEWDIEVEKWT